jgi:cation transport protein ChaC
MTGPELQWVFAYGSLMWNPGFVHARAGAAVLHGYHRQLCVKSLHYRGTAERPGLVFGLVRGGSCQGMAFGVEAEHWPATLAYLRERELITHVYREVPVQVRLKGTGLSVGALTYVVNAGHVQSMTGLPEHEVLAMVRQGHGLAGSNVDYVRNTWAQIKSLGFVDQALDRLVRQLD